jgi:tetratricopeptide (TPR) repeat protein
MASELANRRKYPRIRAPRGMRVRWKSIGQESTSRAGNMGLGGLYLHDANPPTEGSTIQLILELPTGEFHARAIVRRSTAGKGMGIQFVQMSPEDRTKLNQYLCWQEVSQRGPAVARADSLSAHSDSTNSQLVISISGEATAQLRFEREVMHLIELTGRGTYYQILGVTSESPRSQMKKSYYSLARKFHPDNYMDHPELITRLVDLMTIIAEAYQTLENEKKRAAYDRRLASMGGFSMHREGTGIEESIEDWIRRANECLHAKNFVGSIVWLRKCLEVAPEQALYHAMLARSLGTLPQYRDEAIEHFRRAIDLDPFREPVYVQFAELFEEMQLPSRACAVYSKLLEINPTHAKARDRLAALEADEKDEKSSSWISHLFGKKT